MLRSIQITLISSNTVAVFWFSPQFKLVPTPFFIDVFLLCCNCSLVTYIFYFQMICDAECLITNVQAKWPGSTHDSRIFRASSVAQQLAQGRLLKENVQVTFFFLNNNKLIHQLVITKQYIFYSTQANSQEVCWETRDIPACLISWLHIRNPRHSHNTTITLPMHAQELV